MHDVGKIGIPDEVLLKPGKLTPEEFEIIKKHTIIGERILGGSNIQLLNMAAEIALSHHEKWDGSGYPNGIAGENIDASARIVAIADVYDALSNDRVYRAAMPEEKVLAIMKEGRNSHFDPNLFDLFLELLPQFRMILKAHRDVVQVRPAV
jgi:putative two-component system response regulator